MFPQHSKFFFFKCTGNRHVMVAFSKEFISGFFNSENLQFVFSCNCNV